MLTDEKKAEIANFVERTTRFNPQEIMRVFGCSYRDVIDFKCEWSLQRLGSCRFNGRKLRVFQLFEKNANPYQIKEKLNLDERTFDDYICIYESLNREKKKTRHYYTGKHVWPGGAIFTRDTKKDTIWL